MYESPIEKMFNEMHTQVVKEDENMVMKAIMEVGITVDKEELIKALQYDRKQYTKGYSDGKSNTLDKIRADIEGLDRYFDNDYFSGNNEPMYKCNEVLQIIDNYKESDDKDE